MTAVTVAPSSARASSSRARSFTKLARRPGMTLRLEIISGSSTKTGRSFVPAPPAAAGRPWRAASALPAGSPPALRDFPPMPNSGGRTPPNHSAAPVPDSSTGTPIRSRRRRVLTGAGAAVSSDAAAAMVTLPLCAREEGCEWEKKSRNLLRVTAILARPG
ncbi:protein of unknown function [Rhodovastum atsumiense]|nr:protein of unknown function [Rhodovastum atsumiense]